MLNGTAPPRATGATAGKVLRMYEVFGLLFEPYTALLMSIAVTTVWAWRRQRPRSRTLLAANILLGLLLVLSTRAAGYFAQGSLEWSYSPRDDAPLPNDMIVVLGGGQIVDDDAGHQVRLADSTFQRCHYAAQMYKRAGGCRMILCGGKIDDSIPGPSLAETMRAFMVEIGVPAHDLRLESRSRSTYENALYAKPLLENRGDSRVWLVTEALHMNRSERCFRALGVSTRPAPCDYHAGRKVFAPTSFVPSSSGISGVGRATHEWLGLIWYRLKGRI